MNIIPIVFCFDDRLILPAGVCITSLLEHARPDTFYDIFILHASSCSYPSTGYLERLNERYVNFKINYRNVGTVFSDAFEIRNITVAAYYRLMIPDVISEYDKVMYHDVDVIFREDLSELFNSTDMSNYYVGGVSFTGGLQKQERAYLSKLQLNWQEYILSGNLILNLSLLRKDNIVMQFKKEVERSKYRYQDMDIINIVCKGKIKRLPPVFCGTIEIFELASKQQRQSLYSPAELAAVLQIGIVHYNGPKPWNTYCPNMDLWWEYYRNSLYYDPQFYFEFFYLKLDEYDRLPLLKRVKILARYFLKGRLK
ncbi:glycosyltransferase family 8 protein [Sphingobacterium sp. ML3W]|uniref:glycosyltransferase family 8 protein n=1 Tax=Sphingobacterium sp. ML3W TaxID=1538644 RepID=UPI00249C7CC6|nr:glycosyltransferase family 8 protein [Sphingobacterium sp. ML3W]WFA82189.1 glycosyltransferase family 8 protein [Sphingobacterium sp. ML3W]